MGRASRRTRKRVAVHPHASRAALQQSIRAASWETHKTVTADRESARRGRTGEAAGGGSGAQLVGERERVQATVRAVSDSYRAISTMVASVDLHVMSQRIEQLSV